MCLILPADQCPDDCPYAQDILGTVAAARSRKYGEPVDGQTVRQNEQNRMRRGGKR